MRGRDCLLPCAVSASCTRGCSVVEEAKAGGVHHCWIRALKVNRVRGLFLAMMLSETQSLRDDVGKKKAPNSLRELQPKTSNKRTDPRVQDFHKTCQESHARRVSHTQCYFCTVTVCVAGMMKDSQESRVTSHDSRLTTSQQSMEVTKEAPVVVVQRVACSDFLLKTTKKACAALHLLTESPPPFLRLLLLSLSVTPPCMA